MDEYGGHSKTTADILYSLLDNITGAVWRHVFFFFFAQLSVLSVPITIKIHYFSTKIYLPSFQIANPALPGVAMWLMVPLAPIGSLKP